VLALYPLINSLLLLFFVSPYRRFVLQNVLHLDEVADKLSHRFGRTGSRVQRVGVVVEVQTTGITQMIGEPVRGY